MVDDQDARAVVEYINGIPYFHLSLRKWGPSVAKRVIYGLEVLKQELRKDGHTHVFAYNEKQDSKWFKFMQWLGFEPAIEIENGMRIYVVRL